MSTRAFLDSLYATCDSGYVELRSFPRGAQAWTTPGNWRAFGKFVTDQTRAGQNVALGIATRRSTANGTGANLYQLPALFVDLDRSPDKARRQLERLPFRPSWIIGTGRGIHSYLRLKEPADLSNATELTQVISVLRRLATYLGGDQQATDLSRVLRLPGSLSFKYADVRPVTVLEQHNTFVNVGELDSFLPGEIVRHGELVSESQLFEGRRNDVLHALIRSLRWRGLPMRVIVRVLDVVNADWCDPPLPAPELSTLLHYALVAPDRPDFIARHQADRIVHDAEGQG